MEENKELINKISQFENKMVDTESKIGINPLELWMNEMIAKRRKQEESEEV